MKKLFSSLTLFERILLLFSLIVITAAFIIFDGKDYISFIASLIGAVSLIFCAKGHPIGQILIIIFSILYGLVALRVKYYGELATYVLMTLPMAVYALIEWIRHPYDEETREVEVKKIDRRDVLTLLISAAFVSVAFYFILGFFATPHLPLATVSVLTSFSAVFLSAKRSPLYAVAYAMNDIVLIALWSLSLKESMGNVSVLVCFSIFLIHDIYGFISWRKRGEEQQNLTA
jgi:nicotinamide mononucleotide transporter PnuC